MEDDYGRRAYGFNRSGLFMCRYCYPENSQTYHCRWTPPNCTDLTPGGWLEFPLNLYVVVEFFWFMSNTAHELQPGERLAYDLLATGLRGRRMVTQDFTVSLRPTESCVVDKFTRKRVVTAEALRAGSEAQCVDVLCDFFRLFSGDAVRRETMENWVKKVQQPGA